MKAERIRIFLLVMLVALFFFTASPFSQRQQGTTAIAPSPAASLPKLPKPQKWDWNLLSDFYKWLDKLPESAVTYGYWLPSNIPNMIPNVYAQSNFGVTSTGSTNYPTSTTTIADTSANTDASGEINGYAISPSVSGTLQSVGLNVKTAAGNIRVAIYSTYSSSEFSGLLGQSTSTVAATGWNDLSITGVFLTGGSTYYICFQQSAPNDGSFLFYTNTSGTKYSVSYTYGSFPGTTGTLTTISQTANMRITYGQIEGYTQGTRVQYTDLTGGVVSSFSFYVTNYSAGDKIALSLYDDSSGSPHHRLWYSSLSGTDLGGTGWQSINESAGTVDNSWGDTLVNDAYYWFMWQWNSADAGPSYVSGGASNSGIYLAQSFGNFSSTWSGGTFTTWNWSEYASGSFSGPSPSDFTIVATTPSQTVGVGPTATYTLTITYSSTLTTTVNLAVTSGCPANVTCTVNPNSVSASATATLSVPTLITTPSGTTTVTVTGSSTSPSLSHPVTVQLTVTGPGSYTTNVHAGATQVVVTVTWTGSGTSSVALAGPGGTPTLSESGEVVYDRLTYTSGSTTPTNIHRVTFNISTYSPSTAQTWTVYVSLSTSYTVTIEVS
jgi:hypothetical protein